MCVCHGLKKTFHGECKWLIPDACVSEMLAFFSVEDTLLPHITCGSCHQYVLPLNFKGLFTQTTVTLKMTITVTILPHNNVLVYYNYIRQLSVSGTLTVQARNSNNAFILHRLEKKML